MRIPIKLNQKSLSVRMRKLLPSKEDPRKILRPNLHSDSFELSISSFKIESTWKSTRNKRHPLSDQLIIASILSYTNPSILEIGSSSGLTTLELIHNLGNYYKNYFVTDRFLMIPYQIEGNTTYFYHPQKKYCIMCASDRFIAYRDVKRAIVPLGQVSNFLLSKAPKIRSKKIRYANMLHPALLRLIESNPKVLIKEYNVFDAWQDDKVHIVKIANVLNTVYFSKKEIIKAIKNIRNALRPFGRLVITDNRKVEKVSIFIKDKSGSFFLEQELNGGCDISSIVKQIGWKPRSTHTILHNTQRVKNCK